MSPLENGPWGSFPPFPARFEFPIHLEAVSKVVVEPICLASYPCRHDVQITLKDGRIGFLRDGPQIHWLIAELANAIINPNGECIFREDSRKHFDMIDPSCGGSETEYSADEVQTHFAQYKEMPPGFGWSKKSAEEVLNSITWKSSAAAESNDRN